MNTKENVEQPYQKAVQIRKGAIFGIIEILQKTYPKRKFDEMNRDDLQIVMNVAKELFPMIADRTLREYSRNAIYLLNH